MAKYNKRTVGNWGEDLAVQYLNRLGYIILERNFRCKIGEIDIIAKDQEYIAFIEVKYRKNLSHGYPREAVNYYKQKTISKVALYYMKQKRLYNVSCRFDVLEILGEQSKPEITFIKNAFQAKLY